MNNEGKSIPVISLVFAIGGFLLMMNATSVAKSMIMGGLIFSIVSAILAIYSLFKVSYKKWCSIIALILCIVSFITYTMF